MKKILPIFVALFIFACSSYPTSSTLTRMGGAEEILKQLSDLESREGKIFVFANYNEFMTMNIRVNGEVLQISGSEILAFDLIEGTNTILSFGEIFGDEVLSCKPYTEYSFDTNGSAEDETHFFVIEDMQRCYTDLHITKEGFFYIKNNPESKWFLNPWILDRLLNKDWVRNS